MIFKTYESIKVDKYQKLKDLIHDIVVDLEKDQWINLDDLSKKLKESNIIISTSILDIFLKEFNAGKGEIFDENDEDWLFYDENDKILFSPFHFDKQSAFGKGRKKSEKEIKTINTTNTTTNVS